MSKISNQSAYPAAAPALDDYLIGTDVSDSNATKTFTLGDITGLTPANTLEEVLTAGNTATNNIVLTGDVSCTNATLTGDVSCTNLTATTTITGTTINGTSITGTVVVGNTSVTTPLVRPTNIEDSAGNTGTAGQYLRFQPGGIVWETVGANTLSEVLTAGNTATNNIVLTGDISCTNLTATTAISGATITGTTSVTTPLIIPTDIQDGAAATGTAGQYLRKSAANALAWETVAPGAAPLADVLLAGNSATNNIVLTGDFTGTGNITRTGTVTITGGISSTLSISSGADMEAVGFIGAGTFLKANGANALYLPNLSSFADNAAAVAGGLSAGDVYQTDGTAAAPLNVAGILMIRQ